MEYILAIDSGGTKCSAVLVRRNGEVLNLKRFEEAAISGRNPKLVNKTIFEVTDGVKEVDALVAFSGHSIPSGVLSLSRNHVATIIPVHEADACMAIAGKTEGVSVVAGTGTQVLVHQNGAQQQFDGLGPLLGDFGSGFHIGSMALRAMSRAFMSDKYATPLKDAAYDALGDRFHNVRMMDISKDDRATISSLSRIVNELAEAGDTVSRDILLKAADDIATTVVVAMETCGLQDAEVPIICMGSVMRKSSIYWNHFESLMSAAAPNAELICIRDYPQLAGVCLKAANQIFDTDEYDRFREIFLSTLSPYVHKGELKNGCQ
jgi:N-acetylglucosamine kinase-like BadF-type ATPase